MSYYAVIFTSKQTEDTKGYSEMASVMENLAKKQAGFVDLETAHSEIGITVSYWESEAAIFSWKENIDHIAAQKLGREYFFEKPKS